MRHRSQACAGTHAAPHATQHAVHRDPHTNRLYAARPGLALRRGVTPSHTATAARAAAAARSSSSPGRRTRERNFTRRMLCWRALAAGRLAPPRAEPAPRSQASVSSSSSGYSTTSTCAAREPWRGPWGRSAWEANASASAQNTIPGISARAALHYLQGVAARSCTAMRFRLRFQAGRRGLDQRGLPGPAATRSTGHVGLALHGLHCQAWDICVLLRPSDARQARRALEEEVCP